MTDTGSFSIHTTEVGDHGSPVVFLHGLFGQGRNFTGIAKGLQSEHQSLLVDLPNHGRSDWTQGFSYVETADLVAAELRAGFAADQAVNLVGHSMGGKVAMALALRHPDLVERLVVSDIAPVSASESMGNFEHLLGSLAELDLESLESRRDADVALSEPIPEQMIRGFLLQNLRSAGNGFRWLANLELLREHLPTIGGFPTFEEEFDGPVLWVAGGESDYITDDHGPAMRGLFPRATKVTINDAGHWIHADQPDVFIKVLERFFS